MVGSRLLHTDVMCVVVSVRGYWFVECVLTARACLRPTMCRVFCVHVTL